MRESASFITVVSGFGRTRSPATPLRRYIFGGAHWSQVGRGRLGVVITLEQAYRSINSQLLERRLRAQTHIEF